MRSVKQGIIAVSVVLGLVGCTSQSSGSGSDIVTSNTVAAQSESSVEVAKEADVKAEIDLSTVTLKVAAASVENAQGLIEAAGLDDTPYKVDFIVMQGGNLVMEAMAAGQIDLGTGSQIPPIFASRAQNGGNFKVIAIRKGNTLYQELIIPEGSTITDVSELRGKTVGYVKNTTAHYFLAKMLINAGVAWDEVETVALTTSDGLTALLTGDIDALASYGNAIRTGRSKGATTLESAVDILSGDYYWYATLAAIEDEAYHAAIEDYLGRYHEAAQWARENPEEWAAAMAPISNQTTEFYLNDYLEGVAQRKLTIAPIDEQIIASEQDVVDIFAEIGVLEGSFDVSTIFDESFNETVSGFTKY